MASPAQVQANRQNATRSTGPNTAAGKQTCSRNATRHGLTGAQIVMPGEDAGAYEELCQGLQQSYRPANEAERLLVDQIAANAWRLLRAQRVEAALLTLLAGKSPEPDFAIAAAFIDQPNELVRIQRYVTAAQNAYYKAIAQLGKLQKARSAAEAELPQPEAPAKHAEQSPIGFVSKGANAAPSSHGETAEVPAYLAGNHPRSQGCASVGGLT